MRRILTTWAALLVWGAAQATETAPLPAEVSIRGVEFVLIPTGAFLRHRGVVSESGERPPMEQVHVEAFYIAKHEARARDLVPFMNETRPDKRLYNGDYESCSMRRGPDGKFKLVSPFEDLPATHMSWRLADAWARWMGFRLPSEAEWEKAARGPDRRKYPWGDAEPDETYANFLTPSSCLVWPVDRPAKGRSPYGLYNMAGNVREYVSDWAEGTNDPGYKAFATYLEEQTAHQGPPPKTPIRLLKGGRWASTPEQIEISTRLAWRDENDPFQCNGTRFAIDVAQVREHLARGTATVTRP